MSDPTVNIEFQQLAVDVDIAEPTITIIMPQQGVKGDPGNSSIGGYGVSVSNLQAGDVLQFGLTNAWVNNPQENLTDGGNF